MKIFILNWEEEDLPHGYSGIYAVYSDKKTAYDKEEELSQPINQFKFSKFQGYDYGDNYIFYQEDHKNNYRFYVEELYVNEIDEKVDNDNYINETVNYGEQVDEEDDEDD